MEQRVSLELPLGEAAESFNLESVVCSHGLFMMAPNQWDPLSKTLLRPLMLRDPPESSSSSSASDSVMVRISQPQDRPQCLHIFVNAGTRSLSPENEDALLVHNFFFFFFLSFGLVLICWSWFVSFFIFSCRFTDPIVENAAFIGIRRESR